MSTEPTKKHHPVGAYLPLGQLDGDCSCGDGTYPCPAVEEEFPWAVENRVVKGPVIALFRDKEDAEDYVEDFIDLRVRPVEEVLDLLH